MKGSLRSSLDEHQPLGEAVFNILRDAIIDGRLAPGQWLRQEALAQELGISQMPVREAVRRLVTEGLAVHIPYKGVQVIEITPQDVLDMFTVRLALEGLAVRYAATAVTPAVLEGLNALLDEAAAQTEPEQMPRRRQLNHDFHLTICRASGHPYLVRQIEALWDWFPSVLLYEGMRRQQDMARLRLERELDEHHLLLDALRNHDAGRAEREIRRHIRNLSQELSEVLGIDQGLIHDLLLLDPHPA